MHPQTEAPDSVSPWPHAAVEPFIMQASLPEGRSPRHPFGKSQVQPAGRLGALPGQQVVCRHRLGARTRSLEG